MQSQPFVNSEVCLGCIRLHFSYYAKILSCIILCNLILWATIIMGNTNLKNYVTSPFLCPLLKTIEEDTAIAKVYLHYQNNFLCKFSCLEEIVHSHMKRKFKNTGHPHQMLKIKDGQFYHKNLEMILILSSETTSS